MDSVRNIDKKVFKVSSYFYSIKVSNRQYLWFLYLDNGEYEKSETVGPVIWVVFIRHPNIRD